MSAPACTVKIVHTWLGGPVVCVLVYQDDEWVGYGFSHLSDAIDRAIDVDMLQGPDGGCVFWPEGYYEFHGHRLRKHASLPGPTGITAALPGGEHQG